MQLVCIPKEAVRPLWPLVDPFFEAACRRDLSDISSDTIRRDCESGDFKLLLVIDTSAKVLAAAAARFIKYTNGDLVCELIACGGSHLKTWSNVVPDFENWAKFYGAKHIRLSGRLGWSKVFKDYRRLPVITLVKEL